MATNGEEESTSPESDGKSERPPLFEAIDQLPGALEAIAETPEMAQLRVEILNPAIDSEGKVERMRLYQDIAKEQIEKLQDTNDSHARAQVGQEVRQALIWRDADDPHRYMAALYFGALLPAEGNGVDEAADTIHAAYIAARDRLSPESLADYYMKYPIED